MERTDVIDCRCKDMTKIQKNKGVESAKVDFFANATDSRFLGSMLNENDDGTSVSRDPGECTNECDDDSLNDEGSDCELDVSAFQIDEDEYEHGTSVSRDLVDSERENDLIGGEFK